MAMQLKVNRSIISLIKGDITAERTDAIVNAADPSLMGGGGVDGAIHRAAGPRIHEECIKIAKRLVRRSPALPAGRHEGRRRIGGILPFGEAVITKGYDLPAKFVIHTVGPIWRGGKKKEPELLRDCYLNSLKLAADNGIKTISFPSISTGAFGYPEELAAPIALKAVKGYLESNTGIEKVNFVLFSDGTFNNYKKALEALI